MGEMIDGVWHDKPLVTANRGAFERPKTSFRNWVTADGSAGPSGSGGFPAAPGRYHLYVSLACPWAHRTLIFRKLKRLEDAISVSVVSYLMLQDGWTFDTAKGSTGDTIGNARTLCRGLRAGRSALHGPRHRAGAVGQGARNDRLQRIRPRSSACSMRRSTPSRRVATDYYPPALRAEIDAVNERVYASVNNGVYRAGFATTQAAYEEAVAALFETLDWLERASARSAIWSARA